MLKKNVFIAGCNNRLGKDVYNLIKKSCDLNISYVFDTSVSTLDIPVFSSTNALIENADTIFKNTDVVIGCSPSMATNILPMSRAFRLPMVIATTGFSSVEENLIAFSCYEIPIYRQFRELTAQETLNAIRYILTANTPRLYNSKL